MTSINLKMCWKVQASVWSCSQGVWLCEGQALVFFFGLGHHLVGSLKPFQKYLSQLGSSLSQKGVGKKKKSTNQWLLKRQICIYVGVYCLHGSNSSNTKLQVSNYQKTKYKIQANSNRKNGTPQTKTRNRKPKQHPTPSHRSLCLKPKHAPH